jgi:acyl-CoA reductase-like NAD-dependent aldehyde dehydrogenase
MTPKEQTTEEHGQNQAERDAAGLQAGFGAMREASRAHPYPSAAERREWLKRLERTLLANQDALAETIDRDFGGRSRQEVLFSEVYVSLNAVRHARRFTKEWMQRRPRLLDWPLWPARAWVMPQPLGVVGIVAPWNYPLFLTIAPLAGALAAGNRVMIKPSEYTPATSELLSKLLTEALGDVVSVFQGDAGLGRAFTRLPFDHLLFTGSTAVGREVMRAASENLTPVTLELGGKSPAIVTASANVKRAAEDIVYGKLLNGGQTCIAPDYVLVERGRMEEFAAAALMALERYWPKRDYTSIINSRHRARLDGYLAEARARGVRAEARGDAVLLIDPPDDLAIMREEIFGPILPIKPYDGLDAAIAYVNSHERPLALYLFAAGSKTIERVARETVSGGLCVNDTLLHIAAEELPFGGVGASGMGHYHGREGFDTFSKLKPVFRRSWLGLGRTLRPPYGRMHEFLRRVLIG